VERRTRSWTGRADEDGRERVGKSGITGVTLRRRRILLACLALWTLLSRLSLGQERASIPPPFLGEKLRYVMTILGIVGGELILTAEETQWEGRPVYRFELSALSNEFLSKLFLVRDDLVSWVDPKAFRSLRFEKHSVEGKRVRDELTEFDYEHGTARVDGVSKPLLDARLDTLSSVYYLRTLELDKEKPIELAVFSRQSNLLRVEVQARERITTPAGTFDTVRVEPKSEGPALLGKNLVLWLTDDERKVPVQIKSKLKVGTLIGKLKSIERASVASLLTRTR
jgi:uncharacterized protein DUF3108